MTPNPKGAETCFRFLTREKNYNSFKILSFHEYSAVFLKGVIFFKKNQSALFYENFFLQIVENICYIIPLRLRKVGRVGVVARERLTVPRVTMK